MSEEEKKPAPPSAASIPPKTPTSTPPATQPPKPSPPVKNPPISRRAFILGALGVSTILALGSVAQSGGILGPVIPPKHDPIVVANWNNLNNRYNNVLNKSDLYTPINYSDFFYWPYDSSESPYYKNVVARLPDAAGTNPLYPGDPILSHVAAYNTTCVHLRCLVNPGFEGNPSSGEFRLICPCHGSRYRLVDGVPVAGPAFDLGLNPLPQIILKVDSTGNITATSINAVPGVGRTS